LPEEGAGDALQRGTVRTREDTYLTGPRREATARKNGRHLRIAEQHVALAIAVHVTSPNHLGNGDERDLNAQHESAGCSRKDDDLGDSGVADGADVLESVAVDVPHVGDSRADRARTGRRVDRPDARAVSAGDQQDPPLARPVRQPDRQVAHPIPVEVRQVGDLVPERGDAGTGPFEDVVNTVRRQRSGEEEGGQDRMHACLSLCRRGARGRVTQSTCRKPEPHAGKAG
jgi:hypothetical protein